MLKDDEIKDLYVNAPRVGKQMGCKWIYSCENCPFPDGNTDKNSPFTRLKHDAIWEYAGKGYTVASLRELFKVSRSTIYHVLETRRNVQNGCS